MIAPLTILPGPRGGTVIPPWSKSHLHRLIICDFLAGGEEYKNYCSDDSDDVAATRRCLNAIKDDSTACEVMDCGDSASTLRFLMPVALVLQRQARFAMSSSLARRPLGHFLEVLGNHNVQVNKGMCGQLELTGGLVAGRFAVRGDISSQFVSGLLFALPLLNGDSEINWITSPQSIGYINMTIAVLRQYGIVIHEHHDGYVIPGGQCYRRRSSAVVERDWSGAAFWLVMNALGSNVNVQGLPETSLQPDMIVVEMIKHIQHKEWPLEVSQCPDLFPVLAIMAAGLDGEAVFTGVNRLRFKESDRVSAIAEMLEQLGVHCVVTLDSVKIHGTGKRFRGGVTLRTYDDHRIAMAAFVAATFADSAITIDNPICTAKSYPKFVEQFTGLEIV